jgi:hypothetical protein
LQEGALENQRFSLATATIFQQLWYGGLGAQAIFLPLIRGCRCRMGFALAA